MKYRNLKESQSAILRVTRIDVPILGARLFPAIWEIYAWVRTGRAHDGEFTFRCTLDTKYVMSTASTLQHLQMAPLHEHAHEWSVFGFWDLHAADVGELFKCTIEVVSRGF